MNTDGPKRVPADFLTRHLVTLLTVLALGFVAQTGLIPYDFWSETGDRGSSELFGTLVSDFTFPDIVSNIFLYLPVGFFLCWSFSRARRRGMVVPMLAAIVCSALLSVIIEWIQSYSPSRVSSVIDLFCNTIGAVVGAVMFALIRPLAVKFAEAAGQEFRARPLAMALRTYGLALLFMAALPFSFSIDVGLFKKSLKTATWIPFESSVTYNAIADEAQATGDVRRFEYARWRGLKRWSRWAAETVSFGVLVWLLFPVLVGEYRFSRIGAVGMTCWLCGSFAVGLSLIQLPIITRDFDVTDLLFRFGGVGLGLVSRLRYERPAVAVERRAHLLRRVAPFGCAGAAGYIVYIGLIPFTIDFQHAGLARSIASNDLLPFYAYFVTRFDLMMDDAMEKFISYAVFGGLLATCWRRLGTISLGRRAVIVAGAGVAVSLPIELVQAFIPVRVTSLTDPILAGLGCLAGVVAQDNIVSFYRYMFAVEAEQAPASVRRPAMSPTDELISTLTDPAPDAPKEPGAAPKPTRRS